MPLRKHFDESKHKRGPKGSSLGGKFVKKDGGVEPATREWSLAEVQQADKLEREYKAYKKMDKRALVFEYMRSHRVSDIESEMKYLSKDNLATDIMYSKHGNTRMDAMWAWVDAGRPAPKLTDEQADERLGS
jgi:hypothetical protein